jgi:peptidoglycan/LPS O-acetylase OafA/YrhL
MVLIGVLAELNLRVVERPLRRIGKNHADRLLLQQA